MITISEKIKLLYTAINKVVAEIAVQGQINSRHKLVDELNQALANIDCGVYKPELLDTPVAELTKDAERLKCFNQIWRWKALKDGEIIYQYGEHVPALFQKTAELLPTHPPAPDYTDLLKMIAHRARSFPNFPLGHHITEVFAAIGEEPPEPAPAPAPAPELKPLSLDEIHQRYKNLRGNEPPHYIDIYRDAEAALGILRGGL